MAKKKKLKGVVADLRTPIFRYICDSGECPECGSPDILVTDEDPIVATGECPECGFPHRTHDKSYLKSAVKGESNTLCPVCEDRQIWILRDREECASCCYVLKRQLSLLEVGHG